MPQPNRKASVGWHIFSFIVGGVILFCVSCMATFNTIAHSDPASYRHYQNASQNTGGAIIPFLFLVAMLVGIIMNIVLGYRASRTQVPLRLFLYAASLFVMLFYPALFTYWLFTSTYDV